MNDKFSYFVPFDILEKSTDENGDEVMIVGGVVSDETTGADLDGDILEVDGMDLTKLMHRGFVNWNHLGHKDPSMIIGEPLSFEKKDGKLMVKSKLYSGSEMAKKVFDLTKTLSKSSSSRKLGYSIEGEGLLRDPKDKRRIKKSTIHGLAIAPHPKCKGTSVIITKGESPEYETEIGSDFIIDTVNENGERTTVDKELNIEKAMAAGNITGTETIDKPLTQESLKEGSLEGKKKKKKKDTPIESEELSKAEVLTYLIDTYGMDEESCKNTWSIINKIEKGLGDTEIVKKKTNLIPKEAALYMFRPETQYTCDKCVFSKNKSNKCAVLGASESIKPFGSCGFWMHMDPKGENTPIIPWLGIVSKQEAGYNENNTGFSCKRCEYFIIDKMSCLKVDKDSDGDTPNKIHPNACCNRWEADKKRAAMTNDQLNEFISK